MRLRVVIIGAGIVGASIARVLSRYENLDIHLIERESDVGWGVSKANTALIHGGYDDDPVRFPLRAKLCVRGNRIWKEWVKELAIPHVWNGALVIAFNEEELKELHVLLERGRRNGVRGMRIIDRKELLTMEPGVDREAVAALSIPAVGQLAPVYAVIALVENAVTNGVKLHLETELQGIGIRGGEIKYVETSRGIMEADIVINAAGLYADGVARMVGIGNFEIHPRKGEYLLFDEDIPGPGKVLFPAPTPLSKGVVVTTEIGGHLMIGPNARDLSPEEKNNFATTQEGLEEVWHKAARLWPHLPPRSRVIRTFAGLRPEPTGGDFIIRAEEVWGFIEAAGTRSPGLTSAPAIAYEVERILKEKLELPLKKKRRWTPYGRRSIFTDVSIHKNTDELVRRDARYGKIVCRCNMVSEGEILEAIARMKYIGVKTPSIDSVKFRTRATAGICQGAFCRPKIVWLLAREYHTALWKVTLNGPGSEIGIGPIKILRSGDALEQKDV